MLTKEGQIEILQNVMKKYETIMYTKDHYGLCYYIINEIESIYGRSIRYNQISDYISVFTPKNASNFQTINSHIHNYWWKLGDINRIMFLQWMINELSGKNNNFIKWVKNLLS